MSDRCGNRFWTLSVQGLSFNFSFQSRSRVWLLNNIGDQFAQWDDGLIFAVQLWRIGFSVEPK